MDMTQGWLEPWYRLDNDEQKLSLEQQLQRELSERHVLWKKAVTIIARRADQDDILVQMPDGKVAEVHLTWSKTIHVGQERKYTTPSISGGKQVCGRSIMISRDEGGGRQQEERLERKSFKK